MFSKNCGRSNNLLSLCFLYYDCSSKGISWEQTLRYKSVALFLLRNLLYLKFMIREENFVYGYETDMCGMGAVSLPYIINGCLLLKAFEVKLRFILYSLHAII